MLSKPSFFVWLLSGPVLTGVLITVLLMIPSVQASLGVWIVGAAVLAHVVTLPFSIAVGKAIT